MNKLKILLIGQPNVGKSSLLNALVGPKVTVSNYPGTTVEITKAKKEHRNTTIEFIDTPGIYSISDRSEEEKVTEKALFEEKIDGAIVIVDATALERSFYMLLQIMEAGIPVIIALNFIEDAEKKGITVDTKKLEKIFHVPIVSINPLTSRGMYLLLNTVTSTKNMHKHFFKNEYDEDIENAINALSEYIESKFSKRFIAIRILESDKNFYKYLTNKKILTKIRKSFKKQKRKIAKEISITRYGTASFLAEKVTNITEPKKNTNWEEKLDKILLHKIFGPIISSLISILILGILLLVGNFTQEALMSFTDKFLSSLGSFENSVTGLIISQGINGLAAGISIALPYVFLFYIILGILEDTGILSRFIVNAERFLKKLGLPGKAFIPLALGLGCTAPATKATKVLSSKKKQLHTASLFAFIPCSSRIAIIMGIVGYYGGTFLAFSVFLTLFIAGLIWAIGIKRLMHIKSEPLLLELPTYRKPLIKNVLTKSWIRMKDFVYIVIPLLALGGIAYGVLESLSLTNKIISPLSPVASFLNLPSSTLIPLVFGFLQKDLTGAMLVSVLGSDISTVLSASQIFTFGIASTLGIPCIISFGVLAKEFGFKKAFVLTLSSIAYGILIAGFASKILLIFNLL